MGDVAAATVPRAGMLATVRNRSGVVAAVEPFDGETGRLHLVHVEYKDSRSPVEERLLWELEPGCTLLEPTALPDAGRTDAMAPGDFDALVRAARWTALSPYLDPAGEGPPRHEPLSSPFHGAVRPEDYQLVPLLKALRMPRVNLLIADDVGLGKTIEAGLILTELLIRRRIRRVLVLAPAALRWQWRDELWEKFSLRFEVVDRHRTDLARRQLGMDANPWRSFDRIVASYHYLRQPDVREQFLSACRTPEGSPHLAWDLLIVDECHNLMPSPFGEDSDLCRTLRIVAPRFEHRLFLSATPHNGHTRSFTGLLEMLDPVRFTRTSEMNPAMRGRVQDVVIRRLKREINAGNSAPRFCSRRPPEALPLDFEPGEVKLSVAFDAFRKAVRHVVAGTRQRVRAGTFAVEILGKRLLSCPTAFAESWRRARAGFAEPVAAREVELAAAERALRQETGDDRETEQREATAATVAGAWLKNFADEVDTEIQGIELALDALGFALTGPPVVDQRPAVDTRFDTLVDLIDRLLRTGDEFRDDERLIVFTEYKTTLDYLARRLRQRYPAERLLTLFGAGGPEGMNELDRENVKAAFNSPAAPVRILVATDAASEGLNLHRTARYLLHYDCPWNPSRLEQRNGRLDRYGQARDVTVYHFISDTDQDVRFLAHVVRKADEIREDLGSVNEVFDRAVHRRLVQGEDASHVQTDLDRGLAASQGSASFDADKTALLSIGAVNGALLETLAAEIDLDPPALGSTLGTALAATSGGRPQLQQVAEEPSFYSVADPGLPGWRDVIDEAVRYPTSDGAPGPMPKLAFGTEPFIERLGELQVFRPRRDAVLMHLAHPLIQRALAVLARRRYPGDSQVSRWTVRHGDVPGDADAVVFLSVEEVAVNELRETFHRWIRTVGFAVKDGELREEQEHQPAYELRGAYDRQNGADRQRAGEILDDVDPDLRLWLHRYGADLSQSLRRQLGVDGDKVRRHEDERYRQRQGEVSTLIEQATIERLTREIEELNLGAAQRELFDEAGRMAAIEQSIEEKKEEIARRRHHYEEIREQLQHERTRILDHLLPKRFAMASEARVFPVAVEIRLPARTR